MDEKSRESILWDFLNMPLDNAEKILAKFADLPDAVYGKGKKELQNYVYIPGKRKDRIVLVAHADTVWDRKYNRPFSGEHSVFFADGVFYSDTQECGIGADDRAGCAMCWALKDSGHSILIVDGEEHGKHGANYLRKANRKLFRELNRHRYMIELDWMGTDSCLFNQVENTKKFKAYVEKTLGVKDSKAKGGTDLQVLCRDVCGVNVGIGYHGWHSPKERLVLPEWENTLEKLDIFLARPQKRFPTKFLSYEINLAKRCVNKALRVLKLKK